jgi:hypothetical protein
MLDERIRGMGSSQGDLFVVREVEVVDGEDHRGQIVARRGERLLQCRDLR